MFHEELNPHTVSKYVFNNMKEVLHKMLLNGFNPLYSPPHSCSVYIKQNIGHDKQSFGLSRTDPTLLSDMDRNLWVTSSLFELDSDKGYEVHPIGAFIGFVTQHPKHKEQELDIFVGVLVSPTGEEMVGHYLPLSNLSSSPLKLWDSPEIIFPFLYTNYIPNKSELKH